MGKANLITLNSNTSINDQPYGMGLFTTKFVLHIPKQPTLNNFQHNCIWNIRTPNNIKFILWLCALNRLPINYYLHNIGVVSESIFKICKQGDESDMHIFLHYYSKKFWLDLVFPYHKFPPKHIGSKF